MNGNFKGNSFKVVSVPNCIVCGAKLVRPSDPKAHTPRRYCSKTCRYRFYDKRYHDYRLEYVRNKTGAYRPDKKKCAICNKWYVQVVSHIVQRHKMTNREYREMFDLPFKRGIVPDWYRQEKKALNYYSGTYKNIFGENSVKSRYFKGDPKAKVAIGYKGTHKKADPELF